MKEIIKRINFHNKGNESALNKGRKKKDKVYRAYIVSSITLMVAVCLCITCAVQVMSKGYVNIGGYSVFRVVTGSMEPTIHTGAILINKQTDINNIRENDIVCYQTKVAEIYNLVVTHRVTDVEKDGFGNTYLETKGDANLASDFYYVDSTNLIGKVIWYSGKENFLTNMLSFISGKMGFVLCIVFPVLLIAGLFLQNAVKGLERDLDKAKNELADSKNANKNRREDQLLPGYTTLTYADYEAIYASVKAFILEELNGTDQEADTKTE